MPSINLEVELPSSWTPQRLPQAQLTNSLNKTTNVHVLEGNKATLTIHNLEEVTDEVRAKITAAGFRILAV